MDNTSLSSGSGQPSKPKAKRAYHTKNRTGCKTCKIRRLRCDEGKPSCVRCVSTGRKCDGYAVDPPPASIAPPSSAQAKAQTCSAEARRAPPPPPAASSLAHLHSQPKLPMPRSNPDELRSFRFFLEVTAPSFAGVFDADFWLGEIPRACHADPAIWHATVSLGAFHERVTLLPADADDDQIFARDAMMASSGGGNSHEEDKRAMFAVQQFNAAIGHLIRTSRPNEDERWRALTASVLFMHICSVQGELKQAIVHLEAGVKLLRELETEKLRLGPVNNGKGSSRKVKPATTAGPNSTASSNSVSTENIAGANVKSQANPALPAFKSSPVSLAPLHSVITRIEIGNRSLQSGGLTGEPTLVASSDSFSAWRYYKSPVPPPPPPLAQPSPPSAPTAAAAMKPNPEKKHHRHQNSSSSNSTPPLATPQNIADAGRALESLLNGLTVFSQQTAAELGAVVTRQPGHEAKWAAVLARQETMFRGAFNELSAALAAFEAETVEDERRLCSAKLSSSSSTLMTHRRAQAEQRKRVAVDTLWLFHTSCRLALYTDPEYPDIAERMASLPGLFERIVDLAEKILLADDGAVSLSPGDSYSSSSWSSSSSSPSSSSSTSTASSSTATATATYRSNRSSNASNTSSSSFFPTSAMLNPLVLVAHSGTDDATRRRAVGLMRRFPRREALWHARFTARVAELMMGREAEARSQLLALGQLDPAVATAMSRIHSVRMGRLGEREATIVLTTFGEFLAGQRKGVEVVLRW